MIQSFVQFSSLVYLCLYTSTSNAAFYIHFSLVLLSLHVKQLVKHLLNKCSIKKLLIIVSILQRERKRDGLLFESDVRAERARQETRLCKD